MTIRRIKIRIEHPEPVKWLGRPSFARLRVTVLAHENISPGVFLHKKTTVDSGASETQDEFLDVCSPPDMTVYPMDAPSEATDYPYFRKSVVDIVIPAETNLDKVVQEIKDRLGILIDGLQYEEELEAGSGSLNTTTTSTTPEPEGAVSAGIIRPIGNINTEWNQNDYSGVAYENTPPTDGLGETADPKVLCAQADDGEEQGWQLGAPDPGKTIVKFTLFAYSPFMEFPGPGSITARLKINGVFTDPVVMSFPESGVASVSSWLRFEWDYTGENSWPSAGLDVEAYLTCSGVSPSCVFTCVLVELNRPEVVSLPTDNGNTLWQIYDYTNIDDGYLIGELDDRVADSNNVQADDTDSYEIQAWTFEPLPAAATKLRLYSSGPYSLLFGIYHIGRARLIVGGSETEWQTPAASGTPWKWFDFDGDWEQGASLTVEVDAENLGKFTYRQASNLYVELDPAE